MMKILNWYIAVTLVLFSSCSIKKVALDPVDISAMAPGANIYRGTYPKKTDIIHTKLDLKLDWDSSLVVGKALIDAKPYFYPSSQVILDARNFKINQISLVKGYDRTPLKYKYDGKLLVIDLDHAYTRDQKFALFIDYVAFPAKTSVGEKEVALGNRGFYFINPLGKETDKPRQFWTQGEAENNSAWFPTINGPQEKMTQEISITVPKDFVTLSNGYLDFSSDNGDGTKTDNWRQDQPHSTYLTMVAGGNFKVVKDKWEDKEVSYYMEPQFARNAKLIFGKTPEMMAFFSKLLGVDFPWDKYSQIVVRDFNDGAMENTTATVFFDRMNLSEAEYLDENYEDIISHELFHHWFGDLVTAENWANLPLNESFATYGEYLWNEHKYGRDVADYFGNNDLDAYLQNGNAHEEKVIRFEYSQPDQMFDDVSYQKGGRILHMLRKTVGDDAFFKSLNLYLKRNSFKTAEIHDLRLAFEEVTGEDLNWFFNQWFLNSGHPTLNIQTSYDAANMNATISISQQQDLNKAPLYQLPLAIDVYTAGGVHRSELVVTQKEQKFTIKCNAEPLLINVDAEKYLLAEKIEKKDLTQYAFQYKNAPLFMDRLEALTALQKMSTEKTAREVFMLALHDKNWVLRQKAVNFIPFLTAEEKSLVYNKVKELAVTDERSYVRADAIKILAKIFKDQNNAEVWKKAEADKAPSVKKALEAAR